MHTALEWTDYMNGPYIQGQRVQNASRDLSGVLLAEKGKE